MSQLPLRERNKQRIQERILTAAFDLFKNLGYDLTTMDEIAERAEVSRGTLFNYFPTKDALLRPFIQDIFQNQLRPVLAHYLDEHHSTLETLRFLFMGIHEHVLTIPHIDQALKQEFLRSRNANPQGFKGNHVLIDLLVTVLHYGQQRNEVRNDLAVDKLARYVGVLYISVFYSSVMDLQTKSAEYGHEIDSLLAFISNGLMQAPDVNR